ncbi:MAG TPA: carboxypeptidase regulatory-like domain-containing protein [Gemmatimonadaceae bacterium]|nr:carboxypeptidase regulatory-like domain-containing protein [Gemmatimonadaceae bacterium]
MVEVRQRTRSHAGRRAVRVASVVALGGCLASAALSAPLEAQVIRGAVTERTTSSPVAGVLLSVLDSAGATVVQSLSDDKGAFEIRLPGAGRYTVDAKRIGVRRLQLPQFAISAGETRRVDIDVEPLPAVLSSVNVRGRTSCVRNPETNRQTAALWEDARAALSASVITRKLSEGKSDTIVRFERKLDAQTWRVLYETRRSMSVSMDHPFRSLPAEVLSVGGYVNVNQDGSTDYYAPDAEVLLSDTFLQDHCFKIQGANNVDHPGHVGLAFQPVPEHTKPDIKGVLWLDAKTSELRSLEFTYTWLPHETRPSDYGGVVSFFNLPGGKWIVRSWRIRMPEFSFPDVFSRASNERPGTARIFRISEEGGAVPLGVLLGQAGRVYGTVFTDTVSPKPVAGITVALGGTNDSTITASDGTFEIPFVQPGSYTIILRHPAFDSLGIQHMARSIDVNTGASAPIDLRLPTSAELGERLCQHSDNAPGQAIIRFMVVDPAGKPLSKTAAVFSRVPLGQDGKPVVDSITSYDVTLDDNGGFLACGLRGDEIARIESAPETPMKWGETIRPRVGAIGWHVVRIGRKP